MGQQHTIGRVHTAVKKTPSTLRVTYHATDVVTVDQDKIILNTGGYFSATTKTRMNQASNQYGLGYRVYQAKGKWFADFEGSTFEFQNNVLVLMR